MVSCRELRPYFKYLKLFLTALVKLPCVPPQTVWRGVTKDLSAEFSPGTHVIWWAFSSCTCALPVLENNMYLGSEGALLYPPENKKTPWYKKKRTMLEMALIIIICIAGTIVGGVLGSRGPPPPPTES
ncbi:unnamed protein product [Rotaria sordida]|uniref:Uncharacterized protein n=1 Tax=Rotaria sordida TaxID=392033 RepID=A0A819SSI9_9BILA|nr:unnamed protein product [Rotaria sordida]